MTDLFREAVVDADAIAHNTRVFREITGVPVIAVVKADGYGHGAPLAARAALEGGASHLGVADLDEALELRAAGIDAPVIAWIHAPDEDFSRAREHRIEVGVSSLGQLVAAGMAASPERPMRVHIKIDTGLSRNGVPRDEWTRVFAEAAGLQAAGRIAVAGVFSHLSNASIADDREAVAVFEEGLAEAAEAGVRPELRHIAASQSAIEIPRARFDAVRIGLGLYGLTPVPDRTGAELGLRPALALRAGVVSVRRVRPETGVSYDYLFRAERETTLALVPLGYADGVPRQATGVGPVVIGGRRFRTVGRIAMDQLVVDVGDADVAVGDEAVLFGDPARGEPTVEEWAEAADTIQRHVLTSLGRRVPRVPRARE